MFVKIINLCIVISREADKKFGRVAYESDKKHTNVKATFDQSKMKQRCLKTI